MLRYMAQDFMNRCTGFPDLFSIENQEIHFYEIKAEGDSLKQHQLKQLVALKNAGFLVEVLQVAYKVDPAQTYVVVDVETTGRPSPFNRITELGAVKIQNGVIVDTYQTLINPERSIPLFIQQLTGISNEMVKDAPRFEEVAEEFNKFTQGAIFVAHNVSFDYNFIKAEFETLNQEFRRAYFCTKVGMRKHYPGLPSYGLKNLSAHFDVPLKNHHRALSDAEAAAHLLLLINEKRLAGQVSL
jgi:DNA polymerase-3 subunit epsilon